MKKLKTTLLFISIAFADYAIGQDAHFSQAINFPMLINPAYSGAFDGQTRAILAVRNQNLTIPNTAFSGTYNTFGASIDHKIFPDYMDKNTSESAYQNFAFYESYFSNYIEGTQFLIEEAKEIIANEIKFMPSVKIA